MGLNRKYHIAFSPLQGFHQTAHGIALKLQLNIRKRFVEPSQQLEAVALSKAADEADGHLPIHPLGSHSCKAHCLIASL